ncbi:hypothetical protein [Streptomyces vinaceus]|uniref:hypothetical protein n=1 Tax=Streptomyces vinaceus TaxID=1960 RepID=UPI00367E5C49
MRDESHALAVTVGLLLLIGGVLIAREALGLWPAFTLAVAPVVGVYAAPRARQAAARRLVVRQAVRITRRGQ